MKIEHLPLELLRTFLWVAERGGVSRTAEALERTQPAISLQLKRLEGLAGGPLFRRQGRAWPMTERGELLAGYARQMLRLNDEALATLTKPSVAGTVRIGIPNDFADTFLSRILAGFGEAHSAVSLEVTCDLSVNLLRLLDKGDIDLALALPDGARTPGPLATWTQRVVWIGAPGLRLVPEKPVPLVLYPEGCGYRRRLLAALEAEQRRWRVVYSSASLVGLQAALMAGLGVTALSELVVPTGLAVLGLDLGLPALPSLEVGLFARTGRLAPAAQRLAEHIKATLAPAHATEAPWPRARPLPADRSEASLPAG